MHFAAAAQALLQLSEFKSLLPVYSVWLPAIAGNQTP
jgi:hypothetical protein